MPNRFLIATTFALLPTTAPTQDWYVDGGVTKAGNGKSWATALRTAQSALSIATSGQVIWIAKGLYTGTFAVPPGVAVYGNFRPGDTRLSQRVVLNSTGTAWDAGNLARVVTAGTGALLDGIIFMRGKGDAKGGGGALCAGTSPTFRNCVFTQNNATGRGSALFVTKNAKGVKANPRIIDCLFFQNGLKSGNSIHNIDVCNSRATFHNCGIADNRDNGLHFHQSATLDIRNCFFLRNTGRGICHIDAGSTAILENNLFFANKVSLMHYRGTELRTIAAVNKLGYAKNNVAGDPRFPAGHYSQPAVGSPVIDAGQDIPSLPQTDALAGIRRLDGDLNGTVIVDIGPGEFTPNRIVIKGTPSPGQTLSLTIDSLIPNLQTIMGVGLTPLTPGIHIDPIGTFFLAGPVIYTAWNKTGSSTPLTVPTLLPRGTTICWQNLAIAAKGATLSNLYDMRIR